MQLRQYQIDHYRGKIYSLIEPIKKIKEMELQSKKEEDLGSKTFGKLFNIARQKKQGFRGMEM